MYTNMYTLMVNSTLYLVEIVRNSKRVRGGLVVIRIFIGDQNKDSGN